MSRIISPHLNIHQTGAVHRGTVIFLHGSGDNGKDFWKWIEQLVPDFAFRNLKIVLPTAPRQQYTPNNHEYSNVWFDRKAISRNVPELTDSINETAKDLLQIINEEVTSGIPLQKIVIGGFSMGGGMALHLAYRFIPQVAGVFALSSFLNDASEVFDVASRQERLPPLFMWHGTRDDMIPMSWGTHTFETLQKLGVNGTFHIGQNALHELERSCLVNLKKWIEQRYPDSKKPRI